MDSFEVNQFPDVADLSSLLTSIERSPSLQPNGGSSTMARAFRNNPWKDHGLVVCHGISHRGS